MKIKLFIVVLLLCASVCRGQDSINAKSSNSVFVELLGNAILPSINYEKKFCMKEKMSFAWRIGFTLIHPKGEFDSVKIVLTLFIPITVNVLVGKKDSKFEFGIGADVAPIPDDQFVIPHPEIIGTAVLGYRYEPAGKIFLLRIDYTPFFGNLGPNWGTYKNSRGYGVYSHFGGISFGKRF